jgi:hypothetical protein
MFKQLEPQPNHVYGCLNVDIRIMKLSLERHIGEYQTEYSWQMQADTRRQIPPERGDETERVCRRGKNDMLVSVDVENLANYGYVMTWSPWTASRPFDDEILGIDVFRYIVTDLSIPNIGTITLSSRER